MKTYIVRTTDKKARKITYFAPNLRIALDMVYKRRNVQLSVNGKTILSKGKI